MNAATAALRPPLPLDHLATLEASGELTLPPAMVATLQPLGGERFLALGGRDGLCLVRADAVPAPALASLRLALFGSLEGFGIADLFSLLTMNRQNGLLLLLAGAIEKSLTFRRGEIVGASSNLPHERIGQVLYRTGKLTREALAGAEADAARVPGKRFGRLLLEGKRLDLETLHWGLRYQAEEIAYSIFRLERGSFLLFEGDVTAGAEIPFAIDTQGVLMESYQRIDELSRIGKRVRDGAAVFRRTGKPPGAGTDERLRHGLGLIDGRRPVAEIVRATGWGEFATLKALYEMVEEGLIEQAEAPARDVEPATVLLHALIDRHRRSLELLADVLKAKNTAVDLGRVADAFLRTAPDSTRAVLHGIALGTPQRLSREALLENADRILARSPDAAGRPPATTSLLRGELIGRALAEWTDFQGIVARNVLPAFEARELLSYVRAIEQSA